MSAQPEQRKSLAEALEDHSPEGIAILSAEPSRLMGAMIYALVGLLIAGVVWSFVGHADVIVTVPGTLAPDSQVRRVYAPIEGELVDIFVAEGVPVEQGDVLARLNARGAIQAATTALEAQLLLAEAERKNKYLPDHKRLMERRAAALEKKIEVEERRYAQLISEGITKLSEAQKAQLEEARTTLDKGRRDRDLACGEAEKFKRLFALPGGGGVSKNQVDEKVSACATGRAGYRLAEAKLGELDFVLSEAYRKANLEADDSAQRLLQFRVEYDAALQEIALEENKVKLALQSARLAADAADRVKFDNIDEDNFLQILAPVSGIITNVAVTQPGDKVQSNAPVVGIAPEGAQAVLQIEIPEKDRGFLKAGLAVKMKFSAFPYQRYGFVDGTLEYVSPATKLSTDTKAPPVYKGRVSLEKDYVATENGRQLLRYGMAASAEIVVRKRRLIDIALDPFRKVRG